MEKPKFLISLTNQHHKLTRSIDTNADDTNINNTINDPLFKKIKQQTLQKSKQSIQYSKNGFYNKSYQGRQKINLTNSIVVKNAKLQKSSNSTCHKNPNILETQSKKIKISEMNISRHKTNQQTRQHTTIHRYLYTKKFDYGRLKNPFHSNSYRKKDFQNKSLENSTIKRQQLQFQLSKDNIKIRPFDSDLVMVDKASSPIKQFTLTNILQPQNQNKEQKYQEEKKINLIDCKEKCNIINLNYVQKKQNNSTNMKKIISKITSKWNDEHTQIQTKIDMIINQHHCLKQKSIVY